MNDDYAAAAEKHLNDGMFLLDNARYDNAFYLLGYVVECSAKAVIRIGLRQTPTLTHNLQTLRAQAYRIARTMSTAPWKYLQPMNKAVSDLEVLGWQTDIRYQGVGTINETKAQESGRIARNVYIHTTSKMRLDGRI